MGSEMKIILLQKLTGGLLGRLFKGVLKGLLKPRLNGLFTRMPVLAVLLLTAVVAACASGGGGGSGGSAGGSSDDGSSDDGGSVRSSVFSHSSYTFIPLNANISQTSDFLTLAPGSIPTNGILLGSVLIKEAEVSKLVTAEINKLITAEDSKVDANDINIIDNYTIEYSFADDAAKDPSSILNRYLTIVPNIDSRGARIYASNPFAFPVSLADILADVPAVTVTADITIIVSSLVKTEISIVHTVPVNFPGVVDTFPAINDAVSFDLSKVSTKGGPVTPALMRDQSYTGSLSGSFAKDTVINGSTATSFTSLWMAVNANLATDPRAGKIFPDSDNVFKISDLLNVSELPSLPAADIGIIQRITVTLTPGEASEGASEFNYTYPAPASLSGTASADTPISVDILNGNSTVANSLWKAISDANPTFTETNAAGIHVLNISIGWSFTYTYQRDFQPAATTLSDRFVLNRTVLFDEEQDPITTIPIKGVNNALNSYGFAPAPGTGEQRTIFFALLDSSAAVRNPSSQSLPLCSPQSIYLDNIDTQVKSATSFNYEDRDEADRLFKCVLGASFNGADYQPLVARISATATPNSGSNPISGFPGCSTTGDARCYYASLTINITDIDEAPTITYPALSIAEGVGPTETDYPGVNFTTAAVGALSTNDNTTGNLFVVPGNIIIADTDEVANRTAKLPVNATETKVMSVFPTHGNGLFSIVKQDGENNLFNLRVNASLLDYEKFIEEDDLNVEGKAIYMVTISTQDTDGTVADKPVKPFQVPVEITDVRYAPVAAGSSNLTLGFTKATNIENRTGDRTGGKIVLLPGASMIANGRNTLGTVKAVNPETNKDDELFYAVVYNTTDSSHPINNFAVVSGFGDGSVQNLELNKLGLTNGSDFTIEVQAFYRPANFDQNNPVDITAALSNIDVSNSNVIALGTPISIDVVVDDTAYSNSSNNALYIDRTELLNPANSPVFSTRQFTGNVTEATAGDNVTGFVPFNPTSITIPQADNLDISPEFALVGADGFGEFNAQRLNSLGVNLTHSALFSIDKTTGAISLQGESTVEFPAFYSVVVRLANASDITNAENALSYDYATVNILVNDKNTAPVIPDSNDFTAPDIQVVDGIGSYNETANELTLNVTINENTPVGTVLARFTVTDDNDDMFAEHDFNFGANTVNNDFNGVDLLDNFYEGAVKLTFAPASSVGKQKSSTATLTLVNPLNFEDFASNVINNGNTGSAVIADDQVTLTETSTISDKGRYEYNPQIQSQPEPVSVSPAQDVLSASLAFNLVVLDVVEKPLINTENSVTSGSIMENAPVGAEVDGIDITITNINATDADALVYELSDEKFAEVFNATATADGVVQLIVADADKLENLGDGQVHTSTLTITNNTGGTGLLDKSDPITIQVRVIDVLQPINFVAVNMADLQIRETDVDGDFSDGGSGGRYVIKDNLFVLNPTDVSKDADDLVRIGGRDPAPLVAISYAITDVFLESSTPDDATDIDVTDGINFDLLSLLSLNPSDGNNNVGLAIENTDYVEASLFGNISATLGFTGTFPGGIETPVTDPTDFTVEVIKANPKNVEYNTASDNAPVYTFTYSQSDYADEVTPGNVRADAILASAIASTEGSYGGLPAGGTPPQINVTGDTYNTTLVRLSDDDADDNDAYFIERDFAKELNKIEVVKNNQQQVDNAGVIVIPFTSNENITAANIQILSADASGKLEDSADNSDSFYNFYSYFDIKVNNTYHLASLGTDPTAGGAGTGTDKVLLITQKQFSVINSSGVIDESIKYNALDTIPLFEGETETTNRTYYIRVSQGDSPSNASNYALAQVHLNIAAAGLNIPPADCTFAEDVGGTTDCGLLTLPQVFDSETTYNITVGEVLAGQEVNTDKLGLSNFTFTQIVNGNPSGEVEPDDNDQLTLLSNAIALNITINGIDDNVFGEFYIDLVQHNNATVKIRYTISITPVNDAPVFNPISYNFANIPLNSTAGYSVGNVSAIDEADNDAITYGIDGGTDDIALFQISATGEITLIAIAVNSGTSPIPYAFNVIASDGKGGNVMTEITVSVLPDNQAPVFEAVGGSGQFAPAAGATPARYSFDGIPLNSIAGYSVGNVAASDVDGDAPVSYNISGGTDDNALFRINSATGEITLKTTATDIAEYQFDVIASDGEGASTEATISVTVRDLTPPVFTRTPYNFDLLLSEANAAGVVVGKVSATDAEGTLFTYSLEGSDNLLENLFGLAAADNADGSRNIILRRAATLSDFAASSLIFQVVATHQGGGPSSKAAVRVNLINDLQLLDDSDGDGVNDLYDAFPGVGTINVMGNGESGNPYIISNIYQLQAIAGVDHAGTALGSSDFTNNGFLYGTDAADQLTKHYKLANDINASATNTAVWNKLVPEVNGYSDGRGWTPIAGKDGESFSGSLSGEGYAISNLNMILRAASTTDSFGLFGTNSGNINAIGLQNINMKIQAPGNAYRETTTVDTIISGSHAGGLVALNQEDGVISYSYATGLVNASMDAIGGLVGLNQGEISYSYSTAVVQGEGDTGGLVGTNQGGALLSSYATGNVKGSVGIAGRTGTAGGVAGSISGVGAIINISYAAGMVVSDENPNKNDLLGDGSLGGIVGERNQTTGNGVTIEESYFDASVTRVTRPGVGKDRSNTIDGDSTGTTGLSKSRLQGCELGGLRIESFTLVSEGECAVLFPSSHWDEDIDTTADSTITRSWVFNAGEYPSLNAVRSSDNKQLLPSAANQECQRNGMPLGCGEIEFVAVSGSGIRFTPAAGANPASYSFANILSGSPLGYSVGNVAATDPDGEAIAYNISGGDDDNALFQIDPTTGEITLQAAASDLGAYIFNVIASNSQGEDTTATISVTVVDLTPPVFTSTPYNFDLDLSAANAQGVVVGEVSAVDAEASLFDYSLAGSDTLFDDLFELATAKNTDGSINIILSRAATLSDFTVPSVTSQVEATHQVGGTSSEPANITVNLNNDLPLDNDFDADGIANFYDAFPDDGTKRFNGNGESGTPYIISNIYQLQAIAGFDHTGTALGSSSFTNNGFLYGTTAADQLTKHYKLANDIDASTTNTDVWDKPPVTSYIGRGWTPIAGKSGQSFSGSFSGEGYAISNLNISLRAATLTDSFGLFGTSSGKISAVGLENIEMRIQAVDNNVRTKLNGDSYAPNEGSGGLVGRNEVGGVIQYSYVSGLVNATANNVGGLVGLNRAEVSYSYSTAAVEGRLYSGGLVGTSSDTEIGGAANKILSSYATGNVSGSGGHSGDSFNVDVGGLVGIVNSVAAEINDIVAASYATGVVSHNVITITEITENIGAFVGSFLAGEIAASYWYNNTAFPNINVFGQKRGNTFPLAISDAQLRGCGLGATAIAGVMPAPNCTNFFPSSSWGNDTTDGITRGWIFNADEYPSLSAVRSSDSKQLFPSAADQECQRDGMPLGCE